MIKKLFEIAGKNKKYVIQGTILKVVESGFKGAPLIFVWLMLNELFTESIDTRRVILLSLGLAACYLLQAVFHYWTDTINFPACLRITGDLRIRLGEHIRKLSMGFFSEKQAGDLNKVINEDVQMIHALPHHIYPQIVSAIALPTFITLFLLFLDWRMALATILVIPVALVVLFKSQPLLKRLAKQVAGAASEANSRIIEYIQGIGVIKAFGRTGERFEKFESAVADYKKTNVNLVKKVVPPDIGFSAILGSGLAIILLAGSYLFLGGELSLKIFLLFLILGLQIYEPIQNIFLYVTEMRVMDASMDRIMGVLDGKPLPEPDDDPELSRFDIEFKNVWFKYEDPDVLKGVSFAIPQNTITALVGPSGAGKTTVANLIARFWDVDSGEILIGGCNIRDLKTDRLLSYISMVFQDVYLFNDSIINNIKFGNKGATKEEVIAAAKAAQCHEFIDKLPDGYNTIIGEGGATLSGGEKQRIAIARAILKDTPIVILDEATAYVDPENEILIQKGINSLVKSKTLIIIAHRLSTITSADQILVIEGGKVVEQGKHAELVSKGGLYAQFWGKRQKARGWKVAREVVGEMT